MDGSRFDALARSLAGGGSRRGFLGSLLGLGAGLAGLGAAAATCPPGQVSRPRVGCVCRTTGRAPVGGVCPCPVGQERCGGVCVRPATYRTDPANCGACGAACGQDECCQDGACRSPEATFADCEGRCDSALSPATTTVCGQEARCPPCFACVNLGCLGAAAGNGPAGDGWYCMDGEVQGDCDSGLSSECPDGFFCIGSACVSLCPLAA